MSHLNAVPEWDAIVVGGSAAGLSAALMLGRARRRVVVIDSGSPRNRYAAHMHGVLGQEGVPPANLVAKGREEAARYGIQFIDGTVANTEDIPGGLRVTLADGAAHTARALIVTTGITDELPNVPGLAERWGTGVLHCPYCHGWEVADLRLGVLATSPMSLHQVQMVRQWSEHVIFFSAAMGELDHDTAALLQSRSIRVIPTPVTEIIGDGHVTTGVRLADGTEVEIAAIFTHGTARPHDDFLARLALDRAELPFGVGSFLAVDETGKTSHDRIWAAGNVVNPMANVPVAIGAGATAGAAVNGALVQEDFAQAR